MHKGVRGGSRFDGVGCMGHEWVEGCGWTCVWYDGCMGYGWVCRWKCGKGIMGKVGRKVMENR